MKKLNKTGLAMGVALAVASSSAFAGTFTAASAAVGVEAATAGSLTVETVGSVAFDPATGVSSDNRVYVQLNNGATFDDASYTLWVSTADGNSLDNTEFVLITPATEGATELEFRAASDIAGTADYILSSSSAVGGQVASIAVNAPALAAGSMISLDANADDTFGTFDFYTAVELFRYANQFSASVEAGETADAIVDVNDDRNSFTGGAVTDTISLNFVDAGLANGVNFTTDDEVVITLSGDMSTIRDITLATDGTARGSFTISEDLASATFTAEASDVFAAASSIITTEVFGSGALATRTFSVQADLDFETETDKNLVAEGTAAGEWTINGLQAKVSHMSLNTTGFISWLKVANEGTTAAEISADIIYTLADGTEGSVSGAALGSVDAGGVATVSEASILAAIGNPTQLVDASLTVTVAGQVNLIHLIAEKKASDGRLPIPVYYNTAAGRNWVQ